jgi:hypothetical protein
MAFDADTTLTSGGKDTRVADQQLAKQSNTQQRDVPLHIPSIFDSVIRILSSSCGTPTALYVPRSTTAKTKFSSSVRRQSAPGNIFLFGTQQPG